MLCRDKLKCYLCKRKVVYANTVTRLKWHRCCYTIIILRDYTFYKKQIKNYGKLQRIGLGEHT